MYVSINHTQLRWTKLKVEKVCVGLVMFFLSLATSTAIEFVAQEKGPVANMPCPLHNALQHDFSVIAYNAKTVAS